MKHENDRYYFTRLNSEDVDICWSTPTEKWRDAKPNEHLVTTSERPDCSSNVVSNNDKAEIMRKSKESLVTTREESSLRSNILANKAKGKKSSE